MRRQAKRSKPPILLTLFVDAAPAVVRAPLAAAAQRKLHDGLGAARAQFGSLRTGHSHYRVSADEIRALRGWRCRRCVPLRKVFCRNYENHSAVDEIKQLRPQSTRGHSPFGGQLAGLVENLRGEPRCNRSSATWWPDRVPPDGPGGRRQALPLREGAAARRSVFQTAAALPSGIVRGRICGVTCPPNGSVAGRDGFFCCFFAGGSPAGPCSGRSRDLPPSTPTDRGSCAAFSPAPAPRRLAVPVEGGVSGPAARCAVDFLVEWELEDLAVLVDAAALEPAAGNPAGIPSVPGVGDLVLHLRAAGASTRSTITRARCWAAHTGDP